MLRTKRLCNEGGGAHWLHDLTAKSSSQTTNSSAHARADLCTFSAVTWLPLHMYNCGKTEAREDVPRAIKDLQLFLT